MKNKIILPILFLLATGLLAQDSPSTISASEAIKPTLVRVHAEDAHLPSILSILAKESGYNIVTDPSVNRQDKISIHMDDVPIEQAINLVVRAVGLSYEIVGNSFLIAEPKKLLEEVGITSHVVDLKYADAAEVKMFLQDLTDQIQVDTSGNKILVNASPKKIAEIEEVIRKIDQPATQVMLEVRLIEIGVDVEEDLGIDWSRLAHYTNIFAENGIPPAGVTGAGSTVPGLAQQQNEAGTGVIEDYGALPFETLPENMLFNRLNDQNIFPSQFSRQMTAFDVTLDFLIKNNKAEILADSKLVTLNGRKAYIEMVDVVPYILSSGGVGGQVQVQKEEVGIKLHVLPKVNIDGDITVHVMPEVSSIFEFIGPDKNIPRTKKRTSSTTIRVKDNETIIIGGLISRDLKDTEYKVPYLNKIPLLGKKLFTSSDIIEKKTDLIIQITPSVIEAGMVGITKTDAMIELENSIILPVEEKEENEDDDAVKEETPKTSEKGESDAN
ncbi:MAG: secretin N-terminal domain-containing protein [Candidatus Marinimicrobia bacterium]|nr:secretin N-terminal domain-containing protein [Candidatus Neomarinimicrobiota bacterium]MDP6726372.1 secretin N-terminal domain-containing protein [Candidatus Neomarinimicrobiota bacterium]